MKRILLNESGTFYKINIVFCAELSETNCRAELSAPNCPRRIVQRRIVQRRIVHAELSAPNCPAPNCPGTLERLSVGLQFYSENFPLSVFSISLLRICQLKINYF